MNALGLRRKSTDSPWGNVRGLDAAGQRKDPHEGYTGNVRGTYEGRRKENVQGTQCVTYEETQ